MSFALIAGARRADHLGCLPEPLARHAQRHPGGMIWKVAVARLALLSMSPLARWSASLCVEKYRSMA